MTPEGYWYFEETEMLILALVGFLVIMEALNQAYEGGEEDGDV